MVESDRAARTSPERGDCTAKAFRPTPSLSPVAGRISLADPLRPATMWCEELSRQKMLCSTAARMASTHAVRAASDSAWSV
eukprot:scaffold216212_cov32-Tisochrysis_lutea.AAC.3